MYIRRKVFSVFEDEYGDERLFSTTELVNEDDYLDELMYSTYEIGGREGAALRKANNRGYVFMSDGELKKIWKKYPTFKEFMQSKDKFKTMEEFGGKTTSREMLNAVQKGEKKKAMKWLEKNKKALGYGAAGLGAAGLAYGGYKYATRNKED